jgi:hypothetical protein
MSDTKSLLQESVARHFGQSNVPMPQEARDYADAVVEILQGWGLRATRIPDHVAHHHIEIHLGIPGQRTKEARILFVHRDNDDYPTRGSAGTIIFTTSVSGGFDRNERMPDGWANRDQFIAEKTGQWIALYAPADVLEKAYPDRPQVTALILPVAP